MMMELMLLLLLLIMMILMTLNYHDDGGSDLMATMTIIQVKREQVKAAWSTWWPDTRSSPPTC